MIEKSVQTLHEENKIYLIKKSILVVVIYFIPSCLNRLNRLLTLHIINAFGDSINPDTCTRFWASPMNSVIDNELYILVVEYRVSFMSGSEVKYFSIATFVTKAGPKDLSSLEPTDKNCFIW